MSYGYFSHNGELLPIDQAVVPLGRIEYSYGFGVYENIRASKGKPQFVNEHLARLMSSAQIIGLEHSFKPAFIASCIDELLAKNDIDSCNVKILLIGGATADAATLDMLCLNPHFPDRKLYRDGVKCVTYQYEREYPNAKTLNMLSSYLAFQRAKRNGAYDALFINKRGAVLEGTRTNFFAVKDRLLITPPESQVLPGVTRANVIKVARNQGFQIEEKPIKLTELDEYDGCFLTSTSAKILPIKTVDNYNYAAIAPSISELLKGFDKFLDKV